MIFIGARAGVAPATRLALVRRCSKKADVEIPTNKFAGVYTAAEQTENGEIYDKKPFKIRLEADKKYFWCMCGKSHTQPFCDGTHRSIFLKIKQKPVMFAVDKTKDYWLCNCKQTKHRPFCDGTHKNEEIQATRTSV